MLQRLLPLFLLLLNLHAAPSSEDKKLILVFVELEHCPWCHKMLRETIDNPEYKKSLESHYILAKIKRESGNVPLFLNPKYYPTTYVLSWDGSKVLEELPGYMRTNRFINYLDELYEVEMQEE